ncbi:hypothetical protein [Burkholderia pseudomallei]|uniref:hypothetical protein n=1 Tax=Burkholderia pseudomallei TaxID=28450 RepID=UPI0003D7FA71|nr:hypothetical protein [Burkholderia pseudomallei]AHE36585.1 type I restriction-modification system specificity subunit S domain protein [Burkholderia pseudomallei NAU20B-16]AHG38415.1 type I restriction-modification system specificity subunit S domain protein [Burkholderia pseudomallei MSHR511]AHG70841.1 type I restriction-modification system specificity subunit S domain protein [Burkholderia pseudomallei MSHR146]
MSVSIVEKATFGHDFARLDAEYVEHDSLAHEQRVRAKFDGAQLATLVAPVDSDDRKVKAAFQNSNKAIRYLAIDGVDTDDGLSFDTAFDAFEELPSRAQYLVQPGDILVSNVRPNRGAVALVRADQARFVASSGFTLLRLADNAAVSSDYLFALLKTPFMRDQLVRRSRGSMYPAVVRSDVLDLFVPMPDPVVAKKVSECMARARQLQAEFFQKKATSRAMLGSLLGEIGSPPSPLETKRAGVDWTEVDANSMFRAGGAERLDAEFFRSEYFEFDARCKATGNTFVLGDYFELSPGRALAASADTTFYAKQGILTNVGVNWAAIEESEGRLAKGAWKLRKGDILLACTAHEIAYVGKRVDVISEIPKWVGDEVGCVPDLMIIRPKPTGSSYLSLQYVAAFLRSPSGLHQVQRCIRGLRGGHVYKDDLERFVRVPLPEEAWMREFDAVETEAELIRNEAKQIVASAVSRVSDMLR